MQYPLSATVTSESSTAKARGTSLGLVFSMQGVGNLLAALIAWGLLANRSIGLDVAWRVALGLGALPGLLTVYWRYKMHETEAFVREDAREEQAHEKEAGALASAKKTLLVLYAHSGQLAGTALSWLIFDITFYANGLSSSLVLEAAGLGSQEDLATVARGAVVVAAIALPGYFCGVLTIDRIGRRLLQIVGFVLVGVVFFIMGGALVPLEKNGAAFLFVYGLTFLLSNWGPNLTTFVVPSELYPTRVRATCHGISAASGKIGAVIGSAALDPVLKATSLATVLYICAGISILGAVWSWAFVEDMSGLELEEDDSGPEAKQLRATLEQEGWRRAPILDYLRTFTKVWPTRLRAAEEVPLVSNAA